MSGSLGIRANTDSAALRGTRHLRTDHLLHNIGDRAVSGGFVTIAAQAAKFLLNLTAAAVLGRMLSPKEFGLVGMVLGVTGLVGIFNVLGLSTATVQRQTITQQQVSNLFWLNVTCSAILAIMCIGLAPLVAWFYRDPRVAGIMLALSLTFLLTGSTVQHQALLTRQMRFSALAVIDVSSMLVGFATACCLAWFGFAYWALVTQQLLNAATSLVLTWCTSRWRPSMPRRNSGVRPMVSFGVHLTIADFVGRFSGSSDNILIGRVFGAGPLGVYTRANVLLARPLDQVLTPIASVLVPVFSRLQSDSERYRRTFLHAYDSLAVIVLPFAAMCLALARPLVLLILGPKWTDAIPLFSAFALVAVSSPLTAVASWIFESQGRGQDQLRNHSLAGAVTVGAFLAGLHWGPLGMILSLAFTSLAIRMPIVYYLVGQRGPVSTGDLWSGFLSHLPCWGIVYLTTALAHTVVDHAAPITQLLVCCPISLAATAASIFSFRRSRQSAFYVWNMVTPSLVRRWRGAR